MDEKKRKGLEALGSLVLAYRYAQEATEQKLTMEEWVGQCASMYCAMREMESRLKDLPHASRKKKAKPHAKKT
jgi:hypothetical protein